MGRKRNTAKKADKTTEPEVEVTTGKDIPEDDIDAEIDALAEEISGESDSEPAGEPSDEDLEAVAAEAAVDEAKAEAYAAAENSDGEPIEPDKSSRKGGKKGKVTVIEPGKTPGARLTRGMNEEESLKVALLVKGDKATPEQLDSVVKIVDGLAKKVAEKAVNMLRNRTNTGKLNRYTRIGLNLLTDKGEVTSADLIAKFEEVGYKPGTARSQGNQLMQLFAALGVADRNKNVLTVNPKSLLIADYS